jgi:transposase
MPSEQVNLVLTCGLAGGRPQYMNVLPGNVREGSAANMLDEFDLEEGTILVMDRAYCIAKFLKEITDRNLDYIVAARRSSRAYVEVKVGDGMFRWERSAVRYGRSAFGGGWAYRFENLSQRNDELADSLRANENGKGRMPDIDKAGNFMILSSAEMDPKDVYRIYKTRCVIEERFDTAKNILSADRMYMHDDEHILGHMFVTFVALHIWMCIEDMIGRAGLSGSCSVRDVLDTYSVMKSITANGLKIEQTVPKDVREMDEKLGIYLFTQPAERKSGGPKARLSSASAEVYPNLPS